jgi:hypothetical protein
MNVSISGISHELTVCITCGCVFTVPCELINFQRKNGGYHYCYNGHSQGWSKDESEDARIRRERDRLKQQLAEKDDRISAERNARIAAENSARAHRGQVTRLRNRAKAGMCPCCNRHFTNLERHMASKHADEKAEP